MQEVIARLANTHSSQSVPLENTHKNAKWMWPNFPAGDFVSVNAISDDA
jgi:hypothetical protein